MPPKSDPVKTSLPSRISRRHFLANASLAALALQTDKLRAFADPEPAIVRAPCGTLRGETAGGVRIFRGVPFAEPPVGPLRFRPPAKLKPWPAERDATRFAASAMQWNEKPAPGEPSFTHSEDCLYLNIWAPEGKGPFPVFVWIHGGGFVSGHAFEPMYDGAEFARQGIVCVTVAYRLGVFGFLDVSPLLDPKSRADYHGSANNALRDLIAALEWVKQNISAFSGDPGSVTIGGESAGAKLADILMGVPSAQPLFHQVISESGGAERLWSEADAILIARAFGEQWRKQRGKDPASIGEAPLVEAPAGELIAAQHDFMEEYPHHFPLRGELDGKLLPQRPVTTIAKGSTRGKRLLIGTNRDESALFIGPRPAEPAARDLGNLSLAQFDAVLARYRAIYPDMTDFQRRIRALTAEEYWVPSVRVAEAHLAGGGSAFMYRLDFTESSGRLSGFAYHSLDVPLVWNRPHRDAANAAAEAALAKQIHLAWAAFIRGEAPAAPGLPAWPPYTTATRPTMILDTESRVEQQPNQAELRLWDGIL